MTQCEWYNASVNTYLTTWWYAMTLYKDICTPHHVVYLLPTELRTVGGG